MSTSKKIDTKRFFRLTKKVLGDEFQRRGLFPKGSIRWLYQGTKGLIKGFLFERTPYGGLYVWWFFVPLFPYEDFLPLTFGNRLFSGSAYPWDMDEVQEMLKSAEKALERIGALLFEYYPILESINDIGSFYDEFYRKENLVKKTHIHKSNSHIRETEIYCKAYLKLPYRNDALDLSKDCVKSAQHESGAKYLLEIADRLEELLKYSEGDSVHQYLDEVMCKMIAYHKLSKFVMEPVCA